MRQYPAAIECLEFEEARVSPVCCGDQELFLLGRVFSFFWKVSRSDAISHFKVLLMEPLHLLLRKTILPKRSKSCSDLVLGRLANLEFRPRKRIVSLGNFRAASSLQFLIVDV